MLALQRGWIPKGDLNDDKIKNACFVEDQGFFKCVLKRDVPESSIKTAVKFILTEKNATGKVTPAEEAVLDMTGKDLSRSASSLIEEFFDARRSIGQTCDFGGIAFLVEENRTITDDDSLGWNDDEYRVVVYKGPDVLEITLIVLLAVIIGSIAGFFISMHLNKKFNEKVKQSRVFRTISSSQNPMIRRSFALDSFTSPSELENLVGGKNMSMKQNRSYGR
jgi:hypothetical protein